MAPSVGLILLLALAPVALAAPFQRSYGEGQVEFACYYGGYYSNDCHNTLKGVLPAGYPTCEGYGDQAKACFCQWAQPPLDGVSYYYPDPVSCSGKYICQYAESVSGYVANFEACADGLIYNWDLDQCVYPSDYKCPAIAGGSLPVDEPTEFDTTQGALCQGYAYDGYLSSCKIWFDTDGDGVQDVTETSATISKGYFKLDAGVVPQQLGVVRVDAAPVSVRKVTTEQLADASFVPPCYDITSLSTLAIPLAAPWPSSCQVPIVVSPLTTLMANGVSRDDVIAALGLDPVFATNLGRVDMFKAALRGNSAALNVIKAEAKILAQVTGVARATARVDSALTTAAAAAFKGGKQALESWLEQNQNSRRLQAVALDLTAVGAFTNMMSASQAFAASTLPADAKNTLATDVITAIGNAVGALNTLTDAQTSVAGIQKAMLVLSSRLSDNIKAVATGTMSLADFEADTTLEKLAGYLAAAELEGVLDPNPDTKKSRTGAIVGGVVGGVGGALLLAGMGYLYFRHAQAKRGGSKRYPAGAATDAHYYQPPAVPVVDETARF